MKKRKVIICPKCKSNKVSKELNIFLIFGAPQPWKCYNCGFTGHLFPQIEIKSNKKENGKTF